MDQLVTPSPRGAGKLLNPIRGRDRSLQLFSVNQEFPVGASHKLASITSLPFVHTARRYYRLSVLVSQLINWQDDKNVSIWLSQLTTLISTIEEKRIKMKSSNFHPVIKEDQKRLTLFSRAISVGYWLTKHQNKPSNVSTEFYREFDKRVN